MAEFEGIEINMNRGALENKLKINKLSALILKSRKNIELKVFDR